MAIDDNSGSPHSWRTLLALTYVGDSYPFDLSSPWNSTKNQAAATDRPLFFSRPRVKAHASEVPATHFVAITGPQTAFSGGRSPALNSILEGLKDTVLVIEIEGSSIPWTAPVDIPFPDLQEMYSGDGLHNFNSRFPDGTGLIFGDLAVFRMKRKPPFEMFASLFIAEESKAWTRADLVNEGCLVEIYPPWKPRMMPPSADNNLGSEREQPEAIKAKSPLRCSTELGSMSTRPKKSQSIHLLRRLAQSPATIPKCCGPDPWTRPWI